MLTVDQAIAFLPQFVVPDRSVVLWQLALLGVAFIVQAAFLFNFCGLDARLILLFDFYQ